MIAGVESGVEEKDGGDPMGYLSEVKRRKQQLSVVSSRFSATFEEGDFLVNR